MTQSELWLAKWQEAVDFLETHHRKPSKFIPGDDANCVMVFLLTS